MKTAIVLGLLRQADRILFVKQDYGQYAWMLPGGHVRPEESLVEGMGRKFQEEVGPVVEVAGLVALRDRADHQVAVLAVVPVGGEMHHELPEGLADRRWFDRATLTALQEPSFDFDRQVALRVLKGGEACLSHTLVDFTDGAPGSVFIS
ncbi:MAG: NUDIX hydrolase [Anaerolineae bacterium]|nr:NUDIX hydrolase [Anaerolineae bacterium]